MTTARTSTSTTSPVNELLEPQVALRVFTHDGILALALTEC